MSKDPAAVGIYRRGKVYWLAQQRNRKRVFVSLETEDYLEAVQRAIEIRERPELNEGGLLEAEIKRFIAHKLERKEFTRATAINFAHCLAHLPKIIGNMAPFQVNKSDAQKFYGTLQKRMKEVSAQTYVSRARLFFNWCIKTARLCDTNPFDDLKMLELVNAARKEFCRPDLRNKLIDECPRDDLRFILFCGFHAGLRRNEISEARPAWFDLESRLLTIRKISPEDAKKTGLDEFDLKDKEERSIPMSKGFTEFMRRWMNPDADYCLAPDTRRRKNRYRYDFRRPFDEYMETQGCPWVTPHTMRRTFASIQASKGTSLYIIATWLGDDIETTRKHYGHLIPSHDTLEAGI